MVPLPCVVLHSVSTMSAMMKQVDNKCYSYTYQLEETLETISFCFFQLTKLQTSFEFHLFSH